MAKKIIRVLVLEDRPEDSKEIRAAIESTDLGIKVDIVTNAADAQRQLGDYDCYLFDVDIPGGILGHKLLLKGIDDGIIKKPCMVMTAVANIDSLKQKHDGRFAAFVDKREGGWSNKLQPMVIEFAGRDMRAVYLRVRFEKIGMLNHKIPSEVLDGAEISSILEDSTIERMIKYFEDPLCSERVKGILYDVLNQVYRQYSTQI